MNICVGSVYVEYTLIDIKSLEQVPAVRHKVSCVHFFSAKHLPTGTNKVTMNLETAARY